MGNPLLELKNKGQSVWLDDLSRGLIRSGTLAKLIQEDGVSGLTSNPSIFEKSISESSDYNQDLHDSADGISGAELFESLAVRDIQEASDIFYPLFQNTKGEDGYVSLEVSPELAYNTQRTIWEARRLWKKISRPNLMIKVPGTGEGVSAFRELVAEGISVNVTLLFSLERYEQVVEAYLSGLEDFFDRQPPAPSTAPSRSSGTMGASERRVEFRVPAGAPEEPSVLAPSSRSPWPAFL